MKYEISTGDLVFLADTLKYMINVTKDDDAVEILEQAECLLNTLKPVGVDDEEQCDFPISSLQFDYLSKEDPS